MSKANMAVKYICLVQSQLQKPQWLSSRHAWSTHSYKSHNGCEFHSYAELTNVTIGRTMDKYTSCSHCCSRGELSFKPAMGAMCCGSRPKMTTLQHEPWWWCATPHCSNWISASQAERSFDCPECGYSWKWSKAASEALVTTPPAHPSQPGQHAGCEIKTC